jgi:hypothetical protein
MFLYNYYVDRNIETVLGIRDILVQVQIRIRIPGSVPLTIGFCSGSGSNSGSDSFLHCFWMQKKILSYFFITYPQAHHLQSKKFICLLKFCVKILFCRHYFSPLNTFKRKVRIRSVPRTNGSGSGAPKHAVSGFGSSTLRTA